MSTFRPRPRALALLAPVALLLAACGDDSSGTAASTTTTNADAVTVSFTAPADGAHVAGGVHVAMTAHGLTIEPAGEVHDGAGHFHVIADDGCVDPGAAVAKDADHVHFGKAQTEGTIYLEPGSHELCLQPGDGAHVALAPTDTVTVDVGVTSRKEWCSVIGEIDVLFAQADSSSDEFAVKKVSYENIRRLLAQVQDATDQVDATAREAVTTALAGASKIASTLADAADAAAGEAALHAVYGDAGLTNPPAAVTWIKDTCGVDIDS
jgi:hypothetical protein